MALVLSGMECLRSDLAICQEVQLCLVIVVNASFVRRNRQQELHINQKKHKQKLMWNTNWEACDNKEEYKGAGRSQTKELLQNVLSEIT